MLDKDDIQLLLGLVGYGKGVIFDGLPTARQDQLAEAGQALVRLTSVEAKLRELEVAAW